MQPRALATFILVAILAALLLAANVHGIVTA